MTNGGDTLGGAGIGLTGAGLALSATKSSAGDFVAAGGFAVGNFGDLVSLGGKWLMFLAGDGEPLLSGYAAEATTLGALMPGSQAALRFAQDVGEKTLENTVYSVDKNRTTPCT